MAVVIGLFCAQTVVAQTAVSNLGQLTNSWAGIGNRASDGANFARAVSFTTGGTAVDFTGAILLLTVTPSLSQPTGLTVTLNSGFGTGGSTGVLATLTGESAPAPLSPTTFSYTSTSPITLSPNSTYWLQVAAPGTPSDTMFSWTTTAVDNNAVDVGGLAGWTIGLNYFITNNGGGLWTSSSFGGVNQFSVQYQAAIPESSTYAALFGLSALGFAAYRRRHRHSA